MDFDVLLTNARVIDGTGAPWFRGAVGVTDDRIDAVLREETAAYDADIRIDVDGAVVCPGFVDTHSHSDLRLFGDPVLAPKIRQGVTTEILGQDGFSMAPVDREHGADEWEDHLSGLNGRLEGEWTWSSTSEYFDAIEANGVAPNVAMLVGHGTVRYRVLGMTNREPTDAELTEMRGLVTDALEAGAIGLSTGLVYTPCTYSTTEEVATLAGPLAEFGRPFVAHIRSERDGIWEALDEFVDIGARMDVPLHLSHFKLGGESQHGKTARARALVDTARDRGVDLTADQYPYTAGSTTLSYVLPPWVHADGPGQAVAYLDDSDARARIHDEITHDTLDDWENPGAYSGWENIVVTNVRTEANEHLEGLSIAAVADEFDTDPVTAAMDLLLEEELEVSIVNHLLDEDDVRDILRDDRVAVATDGLFGGKPHPRVYGTYPRVLGRYVRDENVLSLETAVRKMTSVPARAMGLQSKGVLRPGMDADLVVFDPSRVDSPATYEQPRQFPTGISQVLINGEFAVRDGDTTGSLPGTVVRKGV
ncbi:homolog to D-aminoacylase (plasmid) [Natrialba magadii ATCC 43099]|uniref:Homolog to D-aminoacylase n=1 Tax=Natrialba magadii (strain ATCC 43099 / DSM 3394 / CCM 3739 / CIP 104546 / IAM 13178 / JCM 8861 / NBRC 102185 / NCIMB 2190 / MS3) TaxID=547559 RepID=D3T1Q5_NATMM|nr:D-aminoacylase [Natrialba magadii]ADD07514.1 homolog to D-aminoacylase [Natrialba magadii ATCC 43099]ELY26546.1 N-acyl-D-glutamate deacylase [Natrialba magadii ATCC 43099]